MTTRCQVSGCTRPLFTHRFCQVHFVRWERSGTPHVHARHGDAPAITFGYGMCPDPEPDIARIIRQGVEEKSFALLESFTRLDTSARQHWPEMFD